MILLQVSMRNLSSILMEVENIVTIHSITSVMMDIFTIFSEIQKLKKENLCLGFSFWYNYWQSKNTQNCI